MHFYSYFHHSVQFQSKQAVIVVYFAYFDFFHVSERSEDQLLSIVPSSANDDLAAEPSLHDRLQKVEVAFSCRHNIRHPKGWRTLAGEERLEAILVKLFNKLSDSDIARYFSAVDGEGSLLMVSWNVHSVYQFLNPRRRVAWLSRICIYLSRLSSC